MATGSALVDFFFWLAPSDFFSRFSEAFSATLPISKPSSPRASMALI